MSKVSRQKLKSVVKECLVEILKEGITTQGNVSENSRLTESNSMQVSRMQASQSRTNFSTSLYGMVFDSYSLFSSNIVGES